MIPGSHRLGILSEDNIDKAVMNSTPLACVVSAGDAVVMHRS